MINFKYINNSFIYVLSDLLVKALPFILIPIITRYLSVDEYGEVALAQTFLEVCTIILIFGSHHYYRYEFFKGELNKELLFFVPIRIALFNFFLLFAFTFVLFFLSNASRWWYCLIPIGAFFQTVVSLFICKFQTIEKPVAVGFTNFSQAVIAFIFTVLLLYIGFGVDGRVFVVVFTPILIGGLGVGFILRSCDLKQLKESRNYFNSGIKFGAKAFPSSFSWWLRSGMDRVLLQHMLGLSAVGVFSIAVQFSLVITVISSAINNTIMPSIFRRVNDGRLSSVFKLITVAIVIIAFLAGCLILVSPFLIELVLPMEYQVVGNYFIPLIISSVFHASFLFLSNILVAEMMVTKLSFISILSSLLHLVVSIIMIQLFELEGLVWSGVISYSASVFVLISVYFYSKRVN